MAEIETSLQNQNANINPTGKLDGRAGMGDVQELIPEKLANEYSELK